MKKLSLFIILIIVLAMTVSACGADGNTAVTTPSDTTVSATSDTTTAAVNVPNDVVLVSGGVSHYKIIRDEDSSEKATKAAMDIRRAIAEITGVTPEITTDYKKKDAEYDPDTVAILVGNTGYNESVAVAEGMGYGEFRIQVYGNKIVVAGALDETIERASAAFCAKLKENWDGETLSLPQDYSQSQVTSKFLNAVPVCTYGYLEGVYDAGNETELFIIDNVTEQEYKNYITTATEKGCEFYDDNEINGNLFTTLTCSEATLNVMYIKGDKEIRICADRPAHAAIQPRDEENVYTVTTKSSVTQVGCEYAYGSETIADKQIGMCYIFKLADGSFIIEDGGFNDKHDADRLYKALIELNGGKKDGISIAAWIFSHTHGDHIGAFRQFTNYYASQVAVERFIFNIPSYDQYIEADYDNASPGTALLTAMKKYVGAKLSVAHPGQVYKIRNATITILFTYELRMPAKMTTFNSSSIVARIEIEGQSFTMLGDLYTDGCTALARLYGKELKTDFLQVAHHGASGGVYETNKLLDPTVLLWPLGEYDYFGVGKWNRSAETYNRWFFESPTLKEIILAGSAVRTLELPYKFPAQQVLPEQK